MNETQKAMIRYLFQNVLSTQNKDVYDFLMAKFCDATCQDLDDAYEMLDAWKALEGFVANHGLE